MTDQGEERHRLGREATTAVILDAAQELFSAHGYNGVAVRAIAKRAGVTHALVHQYVGSKADVFRAVLSRNEGLMLSAAPDNPDLLESTSLMFRHGVGSNGRTYVRVLVRSALDGVPYERTSSRFEAVERLIELAEEVAASASADERAEKDLDPRLVVAAVVSLFLGWAAAESWIRPATGLQDMDDAELIDGLVRVEASILRANLPGADRDDPASP